MSKRHLKRTGFNFYESFSDLIFGTLIVFVLLVLFLALNVREGVATLSKAKTKTEASAYEYEQKKIRLSEASQAYVKKLRQLVMAQKRAELSRKSFVLTKEMLEGSVDRLRNEVNNLESKTRLLTNQLCDKSLAIALLKSANADKDFSDSVWIGGSGITVCWGVLMTVDGVTKFAPIPSYVRTIFCADYEGVNMNKARSDMATAFLNDCHYFTLPQLKQIYGAIRRAPHKLETVAAYRGKCGFGVYNTLLKHDKGNGSQFGVSLKEQYAFIESCEGWKYIVGKKHQLPILYFSTKGKDVFVNGLKMSQAAFKQLAKSFTGDAIVLKHLNGDIPQWVK